MEANAMIGTLIQLQVRIRATMNVTDQRIIQVYEVEILTVKMRYGICSTTVPLASVSNTWSFTARNLKMPIVFLRPNPLDHGCPLKYLSWKSPQYMPDLHHSQDDQKSDKSIQRPFRSGQDLKRPSSLAGPRPCKYGCGKITTLSKLADFYH